MKVVCIDEYFKTVLGDIPPKHPMIGDIDEVVQLVTCPIGFEMYVFKRFPNDAWDVDQFALISDIDESTFERNYNTEKC